MNPEEEKIYERIVNNVNNENSNLYNVSQIPSNVFNNLKNIYETKITELQAAEAVYINLVSFSKKY